MHRRLLPLFLLGLAMPAAAQDQPKIGHAVDEPAARPAGAKLVWADEFEAGTMPDAKRWTYDTSRNHDGWWNNEQEYYAAGRSQNARVEGGNLIIEARHETLAPAPADFGGQAYTSARLLTRGLATWTYGFVEVRAKLACGRGVWPAIWMLPQTGGWPDGGELDIMEQVGHEPGTIYGTIHNRQEKDEKVRSGWQLTVPDSCTAFHRYQMNWTSDRVTFGVDDRAYYAFDRAGATYQRRWPFNTPFYLILNVAVGGEWGGAQGVDDSAFPSRMLVDYVRVYQPAG